MVVEWLLVRVISCPPSNAKSGVSAPNVSLYTLYEWKRVTLGTALCQPLKLFFFYSNALWTNYMKLHFSPDGEGPELWDQHRHLVHLPPCPHDDSDINQLPLHKVQQFIRKVK